MHLESREDFVMEPQEATMPGTVRTLCVSISTTSLLPRFNIELTSKDNELPVERIFFLYFTTHGRCFSPQTSIYRVRTLTCPLCHVDPKKVNQFHIPWFDMHPEQKTTKI